MRAVIAHEGGDSSLRAVIALEGGDSSLVTWQRR
jgi:hypothetical protein